MTICNKCLNTGWAFVPHSDEAREHCTCPEGQIVSLKEENAHLRQEMGLILDAQTPAQLRLQFGLGLQASKLLQVLYRANGRVIDKGRLVDLLGSTDECGRTIDQHVHQVRRSIGPDAIETIRGLGLRLGPEGVKIMTQIAA